MKFSKFTSALVFVSVAASASAEYTGPSSRRIATTAVSAGEAGDKTLVVLEGVLVSKLRDEHYMFQDSTGTIEVEIDHKHLPAAPIKETTRVRLSGEVDKDFGQKPSIDVKQVLILQ